MDLNLFFPTIIGSIKNPNHDKIEENLINHCLSIKNFSPSGGKGWLSNKTYNTSDGKYDLNSDPLFSSINNWVKSQVYTYCNALNIITDTIIENGSWLNIYTKNDFQETHVHPTSVISAIYILSCDNLGAKLFFNSPINNMYYIKKKIEKQEMSDQVICLPVPGTLFIFPSYLPHAVERHETESLRISLSYNYRQ
jgi:uncharacterized protein (TIGR02466 family)